MVPDPLRVRLSEFGESSLVLEIFALVRSVDWNEFLAIKEDLNLRIFEIVGDSGTGFAFPSRTVYFARDTGLDTDRGRELERLVAKWREEKRLPFPEFAVAERAEMMDTLPFPPPESPDYQPPGSQTEHSDGQEASAERRSLLARLRGARSASTSRP